VIAQEEEITEMTEIAEIVHHSAEVMILIIQGIIITVEDTLLIDTIEGMIGLQDTSALVLLTEVARLTDLVHRVMLVQVHHTALHLVEKSVN